jgi:hypothetical protein
MEIYCRIDYTKKMVVNINMINRLQSSSRVLCFSLILREIVSQFSVFIFIFTRTDRFSGSFKNVKKCNGRPW